MSLVDILVWLVVVELLAVAGTALALIGPGRLRRGARRLPGRLREVAAPAAVLGAVLVVNAIIREPVAQTSWLVGVNITPYIYALEGEFVARLQSFASVGLTTFFSYAYVFGYVYLLVFPLVAYAVLEDLRPLRTLVVAYSLNYALGLVCYVLFIAYGPRNLLSGSVESLLYVYHPQYQPLVRQVNTNTNVFPSLHSSLSATVVGVAYGTRERYPAWLFIAAAIGLSVIVSTMYLGIHWLTDVVAGVALAAVSVALGRRYADRVGQST